MNYDFNRGGDKWGNRLNEGLQSQLRGWQITGTQSTSCQGLERISQQQIEYVASVI